MTWRQLLFVIFSSSRSGRCVALGPLEGYVAVFSTSERLGEEVARGAGPPGTAAPAPVTLFSALPIVNVEINVSSTHI